MGVQRPYEEEGESSWYGGNGDGFAGKPTASGEIFNPSELTCAHRTLPLGSIIEVENLASGKKVILKVNDRGPFARGRILDVSRRAAKDLGFVTQGTARVRIQSVDAQGRPAPIDPEIDQRDPYTIQVAALSDPTNIERLTRELELAFGPVTLQEASTLDGRSVKRIRAGSYLTLAEAQVAAERIQKQLRDRGVDPFITRRK
jgi:rare lipoprotein A